jgi:hypothetical protein
MVFALYIYDDDGFDGWMDEWMDALQHTCYVTPQFHEYQRYE